MPEGIGQEAEGAQRAIKEKQGKAMGGRYVELWKARAPSANMGQNTPYSYCLILQ